MCVSAVDCPLSHLLPSPAFPLMPWPDKPINLLLKYHSTSKTHSAILPGCPENRKMNQINYKVSPQGLILNNMLVATNPTKPENLKTKRGRTVTTFSSKRDMIMI